MASLLYKADGALKEQVDPFSALVVAACAATGTSASTGYTVDAGDILSVRPSGTFASVVKGCRVGTRADFGLSGSSIVDGGNPLVVQVPQAGAYKFRFIYSATMTSGSGASSYVLNLWTVSDLATPVDVLGSTNPYGKVSLQAASGSSAQTTVAQALLVGVPAGAYLELGWSPAGSTASGTFVPIALEVNLVGLSS